ncbi:MAG: hypothetical protein WD850_02475, partial [Candidatus Spechtbacterales bacterium]
MSVFLKKLTALAVTLSMVAALGWGILVSASSPTFTNNNAPAASPTPGTNNTLVFDLTLPAPDSDTFLDSDGTGTTGAGTAAAITAGDVLKALAMAANALCGDTDGTTAPSNIVQDTSGGCGTNSSVSADSTGDVGRSTSIVIGTDNLPVISYWDATNGDLKVVHCGNATCSSGNTLTTVDSTGNVGEYTSIAIGTDSLPVISYRDVTNGDLKVAHCGNASCSSGNTLTTVDSTGSVGFSTSIAIGTDSLPVISYLDVTNFDLKVVHCGNATCSSGNTL